MSKPLDHPDYQIPGTNLLSVSRWSRENIPKPPPAHKKGDRVLVEVEVKKVYEDCDGPRGGLGLLRRTPTRALGLVPRDCRRRLWPAGGHRGGVARPLDQGVYAWRPLPDPAPLPES